MSNEKVKHPSLKENGEIFYADTCQPLKEAAAKNYVRMEAWGRFNYPGRRMGDAELKCVNSVGYWDASFQQNWGLGWHRNEGLEISFIESGKIPFSVNENDYILATDNLTITRPWQLHRVGNPTISAGKFFWLIIDVGVRHPHQEWIWPKWVILSKDDLEELTKMMRQNEQPVWHTDPEIKKCFQKIGATLKKGYSQSGDSWMAVYINEILLLLLNLFRSGQINLSESLTESKRTVELFIKELQTTYSELWTLESMAEHCKLKPTRFIHYFKLIANDSPLQYLNSVRLHAAALQLLNNPTLNIKNIGYGCGFSSSEYFATVFRKKYNCTPSGYRASMGL
ncbi:MAG: AraC family transcriptional regulator [Bacteroidota bacterium]